MSILSLDAAAFKKAINDLDECIVVDTRSSDQFSEGFVPGSFSFPLFEVLPDQVNDWPELKNNAFLICHPQQVDESIVYLKKLGIEHIQGWLQGGYEAWQAEGFTRDLLIAIEADELAMDIPFDEHLILIDVRTTTEYADGHIKGAAHMPLIDFSDMAEVAMLPEQVNAYVYCSNGIRSTLAASFFKRHGYQNIRVVMALWEVISTTQGIEVVKDATISN